MSVRKISRKEIIESLRESLERKREWEEQAQKEFAEMRKSQISISIQ